MTIARMTIAILESVFQGDSAEADQATTLIEIMITHALLFKFLAVSFFFLSVVSYGSAGITSTFIRSEWPSTDIPLDNEAFVVPKGHNAPQQYDTKYYYKIGQGDSSREFWFQTPPKIGPDVPYTFGIIGDLGQTYNSLSTLKHYMESQGQTVLFVGDLSYADRYMYNDVGIRWDTWGRFAEQSTAYQPWIWSVGNHEIDYFPEMGKSVPFRNFYKDTQHLSWPPRAPVLFVKYTPQWRWLLEELTKVDREKTPWLIVLMHVPIYNSNVAHFMEGESMRPVFESWFVKYKVDLIFAGHVHALKDRPVYITVGDGGNQEGLAGRFRDPQPDYSAFREASYGHSTLEIKNRTHAFYHWNQE
ncbi:hypothetical protein IFM89_033192 [Coptis chinensis]|uniref:Purple acid phosphatase n=1 Tax=Coptis chinensis TaxID=261450 RepID=A0A835IIL3_9MAGN|nr:hypothetical protein IFM89_033192 [Coptis chinensis]